MNRVVCFIDGFNLYHAIDNLGFNHFKWLDIPKLMNLFVDKKLQKIEAIYYFSAYAYWRQSSARHKLYVSALTRNGVIPVMGKFKQKNKKCNKCGNSWIAHEEKESDVNLALYLVKSAFYKQYDEAFIVTQDSDFAPALKMAKEVNPEAKLKIITPPNIIPSRELVRIADKAASIKASHLQKCLLLEKITSPGGMTISRPLEYTPPQI
ncbi:hypothetical protein NO1_0281 [Candidatus Termititenax aidoneus]|uniref:NYN domain-containing protein n=1 Tax=Termititenax aidoneus TaxID=2218524 RepID=A0A388T9D5_TERA1|nr:hypothetical protein NO1_0281 [Candidatus Termititenax aidoneus]